MAVLPHALHEDLLRRDTALRETYWYIRTIGRRWDAGYISRRKHQHEALRSENIKGNLAISMHTEDVVTTDASLLGIS